MLQQPMPVLDHKMIMRYKVWNGGENNPRGLGFIIPQPDPQHAPKPMASGSSSVVPRRVVSKEVQHKIDG